SLIDPEKTILLAIDHVGDNIVLLQNEANAEVRAAHHLDHFVTLLGVRDVQIHLGFHPEFVLAILEHLDDACWLRPVMIEQKLDICRSRQPTIGDSLLKCAWHYFAAILVARCSRRPASKIPIRYRLNG